jgi:hypothetical protein
VSAKLYTGEITIAVKPFDSFLKRNRWKAESGYVATPYAPGSWAASQESLTAYGPTPEEATERLKDKLCKLTAREEAKHAEHLAWEAGIKETTFSREADCNPVVPRPKPFS